MAFYIPYFVGASMASYLTKSALSYMTEESETYTIEETTNNIEENPFLKLTEDPIILESIPSDIIDNSEIEPVEPVETVETIEEEAIELEEENKLDTIEEEESVILEEEVEETPDKFTKVVEEFVFCKKCQLYLPEKCFSRNQFKKYKKAPTCKICTKLK
tara:strand:+ start:616 stop:1095 length:480 start_codon:yes stop_codon:yes gene_type:complete